MVKFRMSMKSDKGDSKPTHVSIPTKDAIAIVPPKKVIKALYDYQAPDKSPNSGYLSFTQGDFLHVVGRENDTDWFEACNPLQNTRGLVPAKYFEIVGKQAGRNSAGSTGSAGPYAPVGAAPHDSGYADNIIANNTAARNATHRMSSTVGKGGMPAQSQGAMVYGVVIYDFKAERPDELEAKEGEAIIVIAQSNPEWFVAKPITRLGGPGLIPVSFIEIRDMTTGQAVADAHAAVQRAGVPKVEEWKKMAADYKNGSIPLGQLGGQQGLQQGMARMSLGNQSQATHDSSTNATYGSHASQQQQNHAQPYPNGNQHPPPQQLLVPIKASVPRYCFADEIFWFIVECQMEDGRHWELSRLYQDFYDLQINLIQEHPLEAGNVKGVERSLPYMPGPVTCVTDNISNGRRANLDEYIRNLLRLGPHITRGGLVRAFFAPRDGDYEIDPNQPEDYRLSSASQDSPANPSAAASPQSSAGNLSAGQQGGATQALYGNAIDQNQQQRPAQAHYRTGSQVTATSLAPLTQQRTNTSVASNATAIKIKVWFESDSCVVIRMAPQFRYADLYKKLKERRALENLGETKDPDAVELEVCYRDEGESRLFPIRNDEELRVGMERNERLVLNVRAR